MDTITEITERPLASATAYSFTEGGREATWTQPADARPIATVFRLLDGRLVRLTGVHTIAMPD